MAIARHWHSRFATGFVVVGLALSATGLLYLVWTDVNVQALPPPGKEEKARAVQLSFELLFVIFMSFLLGSYAMVKIGRLFVDRTPPEERTEYADAWSQYRLTDEQIKAAEEQWTDEDTRPPEAGAGER